MTNTAKEYYSLVEIKMRWPWAEGLSPRAARRRVLDALVATVRSAPRNGRPAGPRGAAPFRLTPGDRDRWRRGRRPDRLLRPSPPGSVGFARAHRRGPVPGSSSTPVPARRLSPSAARSICGRAVIDHFPFPGCSDSASHGPTDGGLALACCKEPDRALPCTDLSCPYRACSQATSQSRAPAPGQDLKGP